MFEIEPMNAMDPVCGMKISPAAAAASFVHCGFSYYFCTEKCAESFRRDPARFAFRKGLGGLEPQEGEGDRLSEDQGEWSSDAEEYRTCPYCLGSASGVYPSRQTVGNLSIDEFSTIVLSEWRRRLGPSRYDDLASPAMIRTLITIGCKAVDSGESGGTDPHLLAEIERMKERGRRKREIEEALLVLSSTLWDVLSGAGIPFVQSTEIMQRMDSMLLDPVLSGKLWGRLDSE